ncbi:MAG: 4a-hydroxytetrahydrobiopterin dehydratase [Gammaproteobacteria bacterium]|uniref:4a-hydroxytetrahydrobiopterin dehydratase n=1 Tax=Pseudomaricurvus alcaniphilus TaxID=1166482 RepID=UPI001409FD44|nr:4a-hydroxytetrahydrobiopterin dehydratase [Pseudomaricurvus alcaniphilus]MBR9909023.1 4a-hydroxytetrahydrobiopterin dehydratase [Gammaproteobacteria bacterium]NHN38075.1 4a-hydroxytetrahydrobiopterin dehydratase [Pseudomaricurvus alcaniphilus]
MTNLAGESCSACKPGAPTVPGAERQQLLQQLPDWRIVACDDVEQLQKTYSFKNFDDALDFANAIGELAEGANHHPAILIEWGKATVKWWTHAIGGLHRNDFIMAAKTDFLHNK